MGCIQRLRRITVGRIVSFLDRFEDPETLFPQLLREMEEQLRKATQEEAAAIATVKRAELEVAKNGEKINDLGQGAVLALKKGDEATARQALAAQVDTEKAVALTQQNLATLQATQELATATRKQIQDQLNELRARKNEIITRARIAKTRKRIQKTVSGSVGSSGSILDAVARLEEGVEESEAELEIQAKLAGDSRVNPSLARKLNELNQEAEIDRRLREIQAQLSVSVEH